MKTIFSRTHHFIKDHKIWSSIILIVIVVLAYYWYNHSKAQSTVTQYIASKVQKGNIQETVTGSGQVSAVNQLDVTAEASGAITSIKVNVGDHVEAGQLLATIDSKQAILSLESARISYAKLVAPATETEMTNAKNTLNKSYEDAFNSIASFFLDIDSVITNMKDLFYKSDTFLSDIQSFNLVETAKNYRDSAGASFDTANNKYQLVLAEYKKLNRTSATSSISQLLSDTYSLSKDMATALQKTQNTINYIVTIQPTYLSSLSSTAKTNVNTWSSTINSDVASLLSAQNSIESNTNALNDLIQGADELDIKAQKISLAQQEQTYANYFVRAPFAGTVGRIPVNVYSQAGSGTTIATIVGDQKVSTISLNEVDAAKVRVGNPVLISFDAIDGLNATGTVTVVDQIGTVSSGVVSYNVKIVLNTQDSRIRSGMSLNATIITKEISDIITVPSQAIETVGNKSFVKVVEIPSGTNNTNNNTNVNNTGIANNRISNNSSITLTSSSVQPKLVQVTTGDSDDSNTEIVNGLNEGQYIITKTISGSSTTSSGSSNQSIFNILSGKRTTTSSTRTTTTSTKSSSSSSSSSSRSSSSSVNAGGPPPGF